MTNSSCSTSRLPFPSVAVNWPVTDSSSLLGPRKVLSGRLSLGLPISL